MNEESLAVSWKKSLKFLQINVFLKSINNFKRAGFIFLKYFWWLIIFFTLSVANHLAVSTMLIVFIGSFIFFLATRPTNEEQRFLFFIKKMPLFFRWLFTGGIATTCGTSIALLIGTILTLPFVLFNLNLPSVLCWLFVSFLFLPFGQLSQLCLMDNQNKSVFCSIKRGLFLTFHLLPLWMVILTCFIILYLSAIGVNCFFDATTRLYLLSIEMPTLYLFYLSLIVHFYLKIKQDE